MIDYMLKFDSQEQAEAVLLDLGIMQMIEDRIVPSFNQNVDVIGTIYKPDGTFTELEDGLKIPNQVALEGYHVNVRAAGAIDGLDVYAVTPATPYRVWA